MRSRFPFRLSVEKERECPFLAHRVNSRQRSTSVACGAKRTLTEPRTYRKRIYEYTPYTTRLGRPVAAPSGPTNKTYLDNDLHFLDSHLNDLCFEIEIRASRGTIP